MLKPKPLPKEILAKVRNKILKNPKIFKYLPIIDARSDGKYSRTVGWLRHVRAATIKTWHYPKGVKVVIKYVHYSPSAKQKIKFITNVARAHNSEKKPALYELWEPAASPVGVEFIAMPVISAPTIRDVLGPINKFAAKSGRLFFRDMQKTSGISSEKLKEKLKYAYNELHENLNNLTYLQDAEYGIKESNFFVLGYKKGKFIFMPMMDIW
ncbi:MAG: hypothetical protein HYW05_05110 [Candidatus Diapherotrites archaeon]|nr:hypothetical protein [Candidatus Diapherotrites archaeon]